MAILAMKQSRERSNGHLPENQRHPELAQLMGDLPSHCVRSVRVSPEKVGVPLKNQFLGPKMCHCTPQELAQHYDEHENIFFMVPSHDASTKKMEDAHKKLILGPNTALLGPKTALFGPKRTILVDQGHKTGCRVAKQPSTRKPKVSRVTS